MRRLSSIASQSITHLSDLRVFIVDIWFMHTSGRQIMKDLGL